MAYDTMAPTEAAQALEDLRREVGEKADAHMSLRLPVRLYGEMKPLPALRVSLYPRGTLGKWTVEAGGDTFGEALGNARAAWIEARDGNEGQLIRDMALQIIRITADLGECTDAALRQHFEARDVERLGERACAEANDIAGRGPFAIVETSGANAEAA